MKKHLVSEIRPPQRADRGNAHSVISYYIMSTWKSQLLLSLEERAESWYTEKTSQESEVSPTEKKGIKIAAQNRKAFHDYFVEDRYEAGVELFGTEVKSIRAGTLNLKDSYCTVKDGELFVHGMHISPYEKGNIFNKDPVRSRRLLMHKREIRKLHALIQQEGYTLVPLSVYFKDARVKLEIGLCKGKKNYDKRAAAAQRDARREIDRTLRERNR
jgi:SsrA-binding protein